MRALSSIVMLLFGALSCEPRFEVSGLGDLPGGDFASYVSDVSSTGDVVVGYSVGSDGDQAIRWTSETGLTGLGGPSSRAQGVSPDGTLVVGSVAESSYDTGRAGVIWRNDSPFEILVGPMWHDLTPLLYVVDATVVLDDGRVYGTCIQYAAYKEPLGCRYNAPGDVEYLLKAAYIYAADPSGFYGGTMLPPRHAAGIFASKAVYNGAELGYPAGAVCLTPHDCRSEARDFSADGSVVVGTSKIPAADQTIPPVDETLYDTAFIYTEAEGMLRLPDLAGGEEARGAYAIDANGRVIGGFGTDESGQQAVLWVDREPRALKDIFVKMACPLPSGWILREVRAMSSDGLTLVGNGINPGGKPEGFRVVLPHPLD